MSGGEDGPRIVVWPGSDFVPLESQGRLAIDPNATVAMVTGLERGPHFIWGLCFLLTLLFIQGMLFVNSNLGTLWGIQSEILVNVINVGLVAILIAIGWLVWPRVAHLTLSPMEKLAFERTDEPTWLAVACQTKWRKDPAVSATVASKPLWFDVPRWQAKLGPAAPRIVSFDIQISALSGSVALGEPINTMELERVPKRAMWFTVILLAVNVPGFINFLVFSGGFPYLPALLLAIGLPAVLYGDTIFGRVASGKLGLGACRFEPGKVIVTNRHKERVYNASSSVIVVRRFHQGWIMAHVVDVAGQMDLVFKGAETSLHVFAQAAARWVLRPLEAEGKSTKGASHG